MTKMNATSLVAVMLAAAAWNVSAEQTTTTATTTTTTESSQSKVKIEDVKEGNKVGGTDVDEVITNKKMRAEAGSKSKWSIGTALSYNGSTVEAPLKPKRPNIAGARGTSLTAALQGTVGVGYKMTATDRLSLDTGVRWVTPLEGKTPKGYNKPQYDASNPSLTYSKVSKFWGIQSVLSAGPTVYTQADQRASGYQYALDISQNNVYDIGTTGLSVGLYYFGEFNGFDKTSQRIAERDAPNGPITGYHRITEEQAEYLIGISPFAEYVINDTFNLRTVFNWMGWEHSRAEGRFAKWDREVATQSVGLGISVTRDIFLYPNVQFAPKNLTHLFRADETNVALSTNINLF